MKKPLEQAIAEAITDAFFGQHTYANKGPGRREVRARLERRGATPGPGPTHPKLDPIPIAPKWSAHLKRTKTASATQVGPRLDPLYEHNRKKERNAAKRVRQGRLEHWETLH